MKIKRLEKYVTVLDNELMQAIGEKPVQYTLHGQFRNTVTGAVRLIEKVIINKKGLEGKELKEFLYSKLEEFIKDNEYRYIYNFIPYESAGYEFPNKKGKLTTWKARIFYSEAEKESHKLFLQIAREKEEEKLRKKRGI